jgi:hypothetical protein
MISSFKSNSLPDKIIPDGMNFSIYIDKHSHSTSDDIDKILYLKTNDKWVDSKIVIKCQNCDTIFSLMLRKHHCRSCGGVFCYKCCNKYIKIPTNLIRKPKEENTYKSFISKTYRNLFNGNNQLVCNYCEKRIIQLVNVEHLIKICSHLDLKDLYSVLQVNKNYNIAAKYHIAKFRDIQYKSIENLYNNWDINFLWQMRDIIVTHSIWFNSLIKIIYTSTSDKNMDKLNWLKITLDNLLNIISMPNN